MVAALLLSAALAAGDPCEVMSASGPIVACFDPGNRLALGAELAGVDESGASSGALLLEGGLRIRKSRESRTHEHTAWSTEYDFLEAELLRQPDTRWQGRVVAFDGLYLRHLDEGFILLPTPHPTRLPFPFDIAVTARLGTLGQDAHGNQELEVGRAGLLLDVARDPTGATRAALGPSLAFGIERLAGQTPSFLVQPLTGGTLLLRRESVDGLWRAELRVDAGWSLSLPRGAPGLRGRAEGSLERVLFAVNDEPVAIRLSATDDFAKGVGNDARIGLGLLAAYDL